MVGRGVYAIGGDEVSAERAGFAVKKIRFGIFVVNGMLAAVAGLSYAVMSMRYLPTEYSGAEMDVIAAIILGGTRLNGGVGTLKGCILGTLTSYHGIKQSDPSRNLCLLAESIYRCDHYHWYCNFRNAEP